MKLRILRSPISKGNPYTFRYKDGVRHVYITEGEHTDLKFGEPVDLKPGEELEIKSNKKIVVSCLYVPQE